MNNQLSPAFSALWLPPATNNNQQSQIDTSQQQPNSIISPIISYTPPAVLYTPSAILDPTATPTAYYSLMDSAPTSESAAPTIDPFQISVFTPSIVASFSTTVFQSVTESSLQTATAADVTATLLPSLETTLIDASSGNTKNGTPKSNLGLIIGLTFLGVFLIIVLIVFLLYRRKRRNQKNVLLKDEHYKSKDPLIVKMGNKSKFTGLQKKHKKNHNSLNRYDGYSSSVHEDYTQEVTYNIPDMPQYDREVMKTVQQVGLSGNETDTESQLSRFLMTGNIPEKSQKRETGRFKEITYAEESDDTAGELKGGVIKNSPVSARPDVEY